MNEQQIFGLLLVLICAYALWKGGAPERISAIAFLVAAALSLLSTVSELHRFVRFEWGLLLIDICLLLVLLWLALASTRWWPLFIAGLQVDEVAVHLMRTFAPDTLQLSYLYGNALWSYPMILILWAGTWRHQDRLTRLGSDPAWKPADKPPRRAPE